MITSQNTHLFTSVCALTVNPLKVVFFKCNQKERQDERENKNVYSRSVNQGIRHLVFVQFHGISTGSVLFTFFHGLLHLSPGLESGPE